MISEQYIMSEVYNATTSILPPHLYDISIQIVDTMESGIMVAVVSVKEKPFPPLEDI